jgi:endoribonuclease Dicer
VEAFHLKSNFLPPCVSLVGEHKKKRLDQIVSDKNIVDCLRALTGAYLLASGLAGAMKFLKWIGLNTIPDDLVNNLNPVNGLPRLAACRRLPSPSNVEEMLIHLYSGLERLEDTINYTFKDKTLLIEALSHSSYFPNRLTVSYERLEFLGDAVLGDLFSDFLLKRIVHVPCFFQITW